MKIKLESASKRQMATQLKENECVTRTLLIYSTEEPYVGSREIFPPPSYFIIAKKCPILCALAWAHICPFRATKSQQVWVETDTLKSH